MELLVIPARMAARVVLHYWLPDLHGALLLERRGFINPLRAPDSSAGSRPISVANNDPQTEGDDTSFQLSRSSSAVRS